MSRDQGRGPSEWWEERTLPQKILLGLGGFVLATGFVALYAWAVMSLWNWLVPDLFGWGTLDFWKALGLPALICLLFLGVGGGDKGGTSDRKRRRHLRRYLEETPKTPPPGGQS